MANGQQIDSEQGSVGGGERTIPLRSRKTGGGGVDFALSGQSVTASQGVFVLSRTKGATGSAITPVAGFVTATSSTQTSTPFKIFRGGVPVGSPFSTLRSALNVAISGDVIKVAPGNYTPATLQSPGSIFAGTVGNYIQQATMTIEAEVPGSFPFFDMKPAVIANQNSPDIIGMGDTCTNLTIRGLRIRSNRNSNAHNAIITGLSGYRIGGENAHLTQSAVPFVLNIEQCEFIESSNGMLIGPNLNGVINFTSSVITDCSSSGQSHGVYISEVERFNVTGCTFRSTSSMSLDRGHQLKSRAEFTTILACMFDPRIIPGGYSRCIDVPNGGNVSILGSVFFRGDSTINPGQVLAFGAEQQIEHLNGTASSGSYARDGRSHFLTFAQNTIKDSETPNIEKIRFWAVVNDSGQLVTIPQTVRNNVLASATGTNTVVLTGLTHTAFTTAYPNNSVVTMSEIDNVTGRLATPIAGSPSVNDANKEYVGTFQLANSRSDANRGAFSTSSVYAWIPTSAWTWTAIPGTRWSDWFLDAGNPTIGLPPHGSPVESGDHGSYRHCWADSGPCYSVARKELYLIGGGHASTSNNVLGRWNLAKDAPDMDVAEQPTAHATRVAEASTAGLQARGGYYTDGRPIAFHSYHNLAYFDGIDELVSTGLMNANWVLANGQINFLSTAGWPRGGDWRPHQFWQTLPDEPANSDSIALVFKHPTQDFLYYTRGGGPLRRLSAATRTYTSIGGNGPGFTFLNCAGLNVSTDEALVLRKSGASGFGARFVNVTTGAFTEVTVSGAAFPNLAAIDVHWVDPLQRWIAFYGPSAGSPAAQWKLFSFSKTGPTTVVATDITPVGAPTTLCQRTGMFYDPGLGGGLGCLIFSSDYNHELRVLKIGTLS